MEEINLIDTNIITENNEYISVIEQTDQEVTSYEVLHGMYTIVSIFCFSFIIYFLYKYLKTVFKLRR